MSTNANTGGWRRASRQERCPICENADWCSISTDGVVAVCMRKRAGAIKQTANGGFLHRLQKSLGPQRRPWAVRVGDATPDPRFEVIARESYAALPSADRDCLARSLGVSCNALNRLWLGWSADHRAYTFPMRNATGAVVGIRLRRPNGDKFSVTGGHEGLFIPNDLTLTGELLITEGPTDAAALDDLGFPVIGRPCCTGGTTIIVKMIKTFSYPGIVIVADADEPGQRGAEALGATLRLHCRNVRIITPPKGIKDARAWKQAGATRADVQAVIDAAAMRTVNVKAVVR